jgi:hypothetical protein
MATFAARDLRRDWLWLVHLRILAGLGGPMPVKKVAAGQVAI